MMRYLIALIILTVLALPYTEKFLVISRHGAANFTTNTVEDLADAEKVKTWYRLDRGQYLETGVVIKTGSSSIFIIMLGDHAKVYIDEKSLITLEYEYSGHKNNYTCRLLNGRASVEIPLPNPTNQYYTEIEGINLKQTEGRICCFHDSHLGNKRVIQVEGSSTVFPPKTTLKKKRPAFQFFTLKQEEMAVFRGNRHLVEKHVYINRAEWRFAFPFTKNRTASMLDEKEKWD